MVHRRRMWSELHYFAGDGFAGLLSAYQPDLHSPTALG